MNVTSVDNLNLVVGGTYFHDDANLATDYPIDTFAGGSLISAVTFAI